MAAVPLPLDDDDDSDDSDEDTDHIVEGHPALGPIRLERRFAGPSGGDPTGARSCI
jgi:hypothetical protein